VFCFDVARRVLAPRWLIEECRLAELKDGKAVFAKLIDKDGSFRLSKPLAARVMLADYRLAKGVAGLWANHEGKWKLSPGKAYATKGLSERQRKLLRSMALFWLRHRKEPSGFQVIGNDEEPGQTAFVVVLQ
jgi:hypothetical protein